MNKEMVQWFTEQFRKWENETGGKQSISAFGDFLEVSQPTISAYMRGARKPSKEAAKKIAEKLHDYELIDILGYAREIEHQNMRSVMQHIPDGVRERLEAVFSEIDDRTAGMKDSDPRIDEIIKDALKQNGFKI